VLANLGRSLDGIHDDLGDPGRFRFAAVIGLLIGAADDPSLVLIERSSELRQHPGQLAFPGGKPEPNDRDLLDTALREAWEEVALPRDLVSVIGRLSPVPTPTGYMIVPYIGRVNVDWMPQRASNEVERVLTPSLRTLMDPEIHTVGAAEWDGRTWELHEFHICKPPLWGATARMVWDLIGRLQAQP
jgi:8-oxo-dGTP pyrophosphatase MutT (NUDIX family)